MECLRDLALSQLQGIVFRMQNFWLWFFSKQILFQSFALMKGGCKTTAFWIFWWDTESAWMQQQSNEQLQVNRKDEAPFPGLLCMGWMDMIPPPSQETNPRQMTEVKSSSLVRCSLIRLKSYEVRSCIFQLQRSIISVISSSTEILFSFHPLIFYLYQGTFVLYLLWCLCGKVSPVYAYISD